MAVERFHHREARTVLAQALRQGRLARLTVTALMILVLSVAGFINCRTYFVEIHKQQPRLGPAGGWLQGNQVPKRGTIEIPLGSLATA